MFRVVPAAAGPAVPREHQREAIEAGAKALARAERATVVMACGTGKTLVGQRTSEEVLAAAGGGARMVLFVPSLALLDQTYQAWARNTTSGFRSLAVCSDDTIGQVDQHGVRVADLSLPATTDPEVIARFLAAAGEGVPTVVFATYQSSPMVARAHELTATTWWDLVVADEAHRSTGTTGSVFTTCLSDELIPARKRLFLTATPRVRASSKSADGDQQIASMDNPVLYGQRAFTLSLAESIKRGLSADYQVVVALVSDEEAHQLVLDRAQLDVSGADIDAESAASIIGLTSAIRQYDLRRVLVFHNSIAASKKFVRNLHQVLDALDDEHRPWRRVRAVHLDRSTPTGQRQQAMGWLEQPPADECVVVSNVRIATEGVDVPALDAVVYGQPRNSLIEVTQITGRVLRKHPDQDKTAYVILPVPIPRGEDPETALEGSAYQHVWQALNALAEHDDALEAELSAARREFGETGERHATELPDKISVVSVGEDVTQRFLTSFSTTLVEVTTSTWDERYGALRAFVAEHGHCRVPPGYLHNGARLDSWKQNQLTKWANGKLTAEQERKLIELGVYRSHVTITAKEFKQRVTAMLTDAGLDGLSTEEIITKFSEAGIRITAGPLRKRMKTLVDKGVAVLLEQGASEPSKRYLSARFQIHDQAGDEILDIVRGLDLRPGKTFGPRLVQRALFDRGTTRSLNEVASVLNTLVKTGELEGGRSGTWWKPLPK